MTASREATEAALRRLTVAHLRGEYGRVVGRPTVSWRKVYLVRRIAQQVEANQRRVARQVAAIQRSQRRDDPS